MQVSNENAVKINLAQSNNYANEHGLSPMTSGQVNTWTRSYGTPVIMEVQEADCQSNQDNKNISFNGVSDDAD